MLVRRFCIVANKLNDRELWSLAAPMMLSNTSVAVLGLIDTAVIGHLSDPAYLAGVALATVVFDFLYWGVTFLRMGTTGVVAQSRGQDNYADMRAILRDALFIAMTVAGVMLLLRNDLVSFALDLLAGSEDAQAHAREYYGIKIWGAPGVLGTMVVIGWLIGMQNGRAAMLLAALPCLLQAALDIVFVVVMDLGVAGAAYAALVTSYLAGGLGFVLIRSELRRFPLADKLRWQWRGFRRLLSLNWNILLRTLCLIATFAFFTYQGALQGDVVLAANAILLNFQMLTALSLDGFANAIEALVGRAIGARNRVKFLQAVKSGGSWAVLFAVFCTAIYAAFGDELISLLTDIPALRLVAGEYLIWAIVLPFASVWCFIGDGIFIGATRGNEMRNSMAFASVVVFLPAWYALRGWQNHGLWLAFVLFFVARGVSMLWYLLRIDRRRGFV